MNMSTSASVSLSSKMSTQRLRIGVLRSSAIVKPEYAQAGPSTLTRQCLPTETRPCVVSLTTRRSFSGSQVGHCSFRNGGFLSRTLKAKNGSRWKATWLDSSAQVEADVSIAEAWELWNDRERINRWMPWIHSVKVQVDQPELSKWTLKYTAFGQNLEFSWLARNLKPIHHQKIHWRAVDGLPNRGTVRFYPRGPKSCAVQLTISYEVPEVLAGMASALNPLVESILQQDMDRFAKFVKTERLESQRN